MSSLTILNSDKRIKPTQFVAFWTSYYDYKSKERYESNIKRRRLSPRSIQALFEWKNNMKLSRRKQKTVNLIKKNIKTVNELKANFDEPLFKERFGKIALVWRIFLMHIINPRSYPLYDQHIHRAYVFINSGKVSNAKLTTSEKLSFYKDDYIQFFDTLCKEGNIKKRKRLDDALWAFGKFLSAYHKMVM